MSQFSNEQVMLTLSLLSYGGFWKTGSDGDLKRKRLAKSVKYGLENLPTLDGQWKLIWGPASYRYLGTLFDSSMMYVVQNCANPSRFAIVVRGTNPIALSDWLFGDFLYHRQVPWHYGDHSLAPEAKVSLSTALGLKILLGMRSEADPGMLSKEKKFNFLYDRLSASRSHPETSAIFAEQPLPDEKQETPNRTLRRLLPKLASYQEFWKLAAQGTENLAYSIGQFLPTDEMIRIYSLRRRLIRLMDVALDAYTEIPVGVLMPNESPEEEEDKEGIGLLELLGNLAEEHGKRLEISVTGHSKGGALAPALALFLSDTQNDLVAVPEHYQWNPGPDAKIVCYGFAGPTPGNCNFARYFNEQLGKNYYRYNNMMDFASLAWTDEFRHAAYLYQGHVASVPGLDELVHEVADDVAAMDYCHLGRDYSLWDNLKRVTDKHVFLFDGKIDPDKKSYMQQWAYQHIDAFIDELGLSDVMSIEDVLGVSIDSSEEE